MDPRRLGAWVVVLCAIGGLACAGVGAPPATSSPAAGEVALSLPELVKQRGPSVVLIEAQGPEGPSQGSGVIVDPSGKVLTCYHVVKGARSVLVKTWNGGYFPAVGLLGMNPKADFALLKLEAKELPSVPIGDYRKLQPGESIFVISSPDALQNTVSEGVVSAVRKVADLPDDFRPELREAGFSDAQELIQFSAPTYFGSSGGPLFNAQGEVVGLVAIRHEADAAYFAIPARLAEPHLPATALVAKFGPEGREAGRGAELVDPDYGELAPSVGRLDPRKETEVRTVPAKGEATLTLRYAGFVDPATVTVREVDTGEQLTRVSSTPEPGQYRAVRGGVVSFHQAQAGRRVEIGYEYRVERVAVLPIVNQSGFPELTSLLQERIVEALTAHGYEMAASAEVEAVVRDTAINVSSTAFGDAHSLVPASIRRIAADTNSSLVLYVMIQAQEVGTSQYVAVYLGVFDAHTGLDLYTRLLEEKQGAAFGGRKGKREHAASTMMARLLAEYFGPLPKRPR